MILKLLAKILALKPVRTALIKQAQKTPYYHLVNRQGKVYMYRWWLFNPKLGNAPDGTEWFRWPNLPSIRIHWIKRRDLDRHLHDHPANCRTFVLQNWYKEKRQAYLNLPIGPITLTNEYVFSTRRAGQTATIDFGEYHSITEVAPGGVWTMFVIGPRKGMWGFLVDGVKVPFKEYLNKHGGDA
jgi:hypothetical protein